MIHKGLTINADLHAPKVPVESLRLGDWIVHRGTRTTVQDDGTWTRDHNYPWLALLISHQVDESGKWGNEKRFFVPETGVSLLLPRTEMVVRATTVDITVSA